MAVLLSTTILSSISAQTKLSFNHVNGCIRESKPSSATTSLLHFPGLSLDYRRHSNRKVLFVSLAVNNRTSVKTVKRYNGKLMSEGRDEDEKYGSVCPGCGVFMQDQDPDLPGYYQEKKIAEGKLSEDEEGGVDEDEDEDDEEIDVLLDGDEGERGFDEDDGEFDLLLDGDEGESGFDEDYDKIDMLLDMDGDEEEEEVLDDGGDELEGSEGEEGKLEKDDEFDWDGDELEEKLFGESDDFEYNGFAPADVGYGNIREDTIKKGKKEKVSKSERKRLAREAMKVKDEVTVCARCHSLRNYGQVKNQTAENLIPDFDFNRLISTRLVKPGHANSTVVVMVVDCVDFDGSFPKRAAKSLFEALERTKDDPKQKRLPKLVLVATKVDLLPSQISPTRLDRWVRQRARAGGAPKLSGVYLVSSRKDLGVRNLLSFIKGLAGPRGNVWIIGAQNAGKSTLINAFAKKGGVKVTKLTEAPVPGTTLGIVRIGGVLSAKAKMYDTPGLLHPYLMCMRLNREEQKIVEIRKELKPRSYRILAGQTILVGGLMRLDLKEASVTTIYVTVWASPNVSLHMGKTENADEFWKNHIGVRLQPPAGADRASELGKWEPREIEVSGESWDVNSVDIAVAGFGWFSFGLKGKATLTLWIYEGIETTIRDPLVLDRAKFIERPGFWLPKAISDALRDQSKLEGKRNKTPEEEEEDMDSFLEVYT